MITETFYKFAEKTFDEEYKKNPARTALGFAGSGAIIGGSYGAGRILGSVLSDNEDIKAYKKMIDSNNTVLDAAKVPADMAKASKNIINNKIQNAVSKKQVRKLRKKLKPFYDAERAVKSIVTDTQASSSDFAKKIEELAAHKKYLKSVKGIGKYVGIPAAIGAGVGGIGAAGYGLRHKLAD